MSLVKKGKAGPKDKAFSKPEVLRVAKAVIARGPVCDHCLGRQLAQVSTGMTDLERGAILRRLLKAKPEGGDCPVCGGLFKRLGKFADDAAGRLSKMEYATFVVGTKLSGELIGAEEAVWEDAGIDYCESIKSELNRELGKLLEARIHKVVDEEKPDVTVTLNLEKDRVDIRAAPLFFSGAYKKLVRGIPQTKWDKYEVTVEDVIAAPFMAATKGEGHSMHASGREDIDARCLDWRPFILEIENPSKRTVDLRKMLKEVNASGKVEVSGLEATVRKEVAGLKDLRLDKSYRALVEFEKPVTGVERVQKLIGTISQRTPVRVAHRRADLVRKRKVKDIKWKKINNKKFEFQIKGEAGLYIKELISGDGGRTRPSVSEILGNQGAVKELDVIKIWR